MMPENISTYGHMVDDLILTTFIIALVVTLFSFGFLIYMLVRFRSGKSPKSTPEVTGPIAKLVYLVGLMLVFDIIIGVMSVRSWSHIIKRSPQEVEQEYKESVKVKVIGRQFFWSMVYAGRDNTFETNDDFTLGNLLVVPKDTAVFLTCTSGDVIHSFFAPNLRLKYDCVPGREVNLWFVATKAGDYEIACAELCGPLHSRMKATLRVLTKEDYKKWLDARYPESILVSK